MNECDICKINFSSKQCLTRHLKTQVHKNNAENIKLFCEICELDFNSTYCLNMHLESKKHAKKENKHNKVKTCDNYCETCDKYLMTDAGIEKHFKSIKHLKKVECNKMLDNIDSLEEYKIPLYNKEHIITGYTIVDKNTYNAILHYSAYNEGGYGSIIINGVTTKISHYVYYILNKKEKKDNTVIDHINRNTFDDRIENLRDISIQLNNRNRSKQANKTSKYYGVHKTKHNKWNCQFNYNNISYDFLYENESHAAYHYNLMVIKYGFKDITPINDINEPPDFILKTNNKELYNLPKGIIIKKNLYYFIYDRKHYGSYNTIDEAVIAQKIYTEQAIITKRNDILSQPIKRNKDGIAFIEAFYKDVKIGDILVDDDIYYKLQEYPIHLIHHINKNAYYAQITVDGHIYKLARYILNYHGSDHVDHKNGSTFDNRRINLRPLSANLNAQNKGSVKGSSSIYVGVYFDKSRNKWGAALKHKNKSNYYGFYDTEREAAIVRDEHAKKLNEEQGCCYRLNNL